MTETDVQPVGRSEFERGVREGVHNALAFFKDENGYSILGAYTDAGLANIEDAAVNLTLSDEARSAGLLASKPVATSDKAALRTAAAQLEAVRALTRDPAHTYSLNNVTEWDVKAGITRPSVTPMFVERDALLAILTADTAPQECRNG